MESSESQYQTPSNPDETPNQKQARLRRERRDAKIKAGGSSRLEKISNVSGRQNLPIPEPPLLAQQEQSQPTTHADPDEVDLSTHLSSSRTPNTTTNASMTAPTGPTEADIRALLRGGAPQPSVDIQPRKQQRQQQQQQGQQMQHGGEEEEEEEEEDPMMKMLQQLMGGVPGADGRPGEGGLPPGLAAMLGAGGMGGQAASQQDEAGGSYAYVWRIVHAIFAFALGIYITAASHAFNGDVTRGGIEGYGHEGGVNAFWVFATAELVLQSSRFFWEQGGKGGGGLGGWMGVGAGMLPEPWRGWVQLAARYAGIWSTVVQDGMVVVFVVGVVAWWKGAVG